MVCGANSSLAVSIWRKLERFELTRQRRYCEKECGANRSEGEKALQKHSASPHRYEALRREFWNTSSMMVAATLLTLATASRVSIRLAVTVCIDTFSVNKAESAAIIKATPTIVEEAFIFYL